MANAKITDDPEKKSYLASVKKDPANFKRLPEELQNDKDFVRAAVRANAMYPVVLSYAPESIRGDKEFIMSIVTKGNGFHAFGFASDKLRHDRDFIIAVVSKCPVILGNSLACKSDTLGYPAIPREFHNDEQILAAGSRGPF